METKVEVLRAKVTPTQRDCFISEAARRGLTISDALRLALDEWVRSGKNEELLKRLLTKDREGNHATTQL